MMIPYESGQADLSGFGGLGAEMFGEILQSPRMQEDIQGTAVAALDSPDVQAALERAALPLMAKAAIFVGGAVFLAVILARRS